MTEQPKRGEKCVGLYDGHGQDRNWCQVHVQTLSQCSRSWQAKYDALAAELKEARQAIGKTARDAECARLLAVERYEALARVIPDFIAGRTQELTPQLEALITYVDGLKARVEAETWEKAAKVSAPSGPMMAPDYLPNRIREIFEEKAAEARNAK